MLHTKFRRNWHVGSGEEVFGRVFTIYGRCGHLGHVTSIMSSDFHFLVPERFRSQFLRKSSLNVCMNTTLGQGQEMTLTFNTHISSYIQLDVCSY